MSKRSKKEHRQGQPKPAAAPSAYLPSSDPPRANLALLVTSGVLLALWLVVLAWLARSA